MALGETKDATYPKSYAPERPSARVVVGKRRRPERPDGIEALRATDTDPDKRSARTPAAPIEGLMLSTTGGEYPPHRLHARCGDACYRNDQVDPPRPFNPYGAPARSDGAGQTPIAPYATVARHALMVSAAANLLGGAASAFQFAFGLRRFGGVEYVPRVIGLAALRSYASSSAFALTCLTAVAVVHRAARSTAGPVAIESRGASFVGGAIALLYPVNVACILAGGLAFMRAAYAQSARDFIASCAESITWSDAAYGATTTVGYALLATLLLPPCLRVVAASRRSLVVKLVVAWLATVLVVEAVGVVTSWVVSLNLTSSIAIAG